MAKTSAQRTRAYEAKQIAKGHCQTCGKPRGESGSKARCGKCLIEQRRYSRNHYYRSTGQFDRVQCHCGCTGSVPAGEHYATATCPRKLGRVAQPSGVVCQTCPAPLRKQDVSNGCTRCKACRATGSGRWLTHTPSTRAARPHRERPRKPQVDTSSSWWVNASRAALAEEIRKRYVGAA